MELSIVPFFWSRRAVSNGGLLLSVAYELSCFMRLFEVGPTGGPKVGPEV